MRGSPIVIAGHEVKLLHQADWTPQMLAVAHVFVERAGRDKPKDPTRRDIWVDFTDAPEWEYIYYLDQEYPCHHLILNYARTKEIIEAGDLSELTKLMPKELR